MALFGRLEEVEKQLGKRSALTAVFQYLREANTVGSEINQRILNLNVDEYEKIELAAGIYVIEQSYNTRLVADSFFEAHIKYVDMQFMVTGEELIEVAHIEELEQTATYDKELDYSKFATDVDSSTILLKAANLAVLFPGDGHMPAIETSNGSVRIYKSVVKVPVALLCSG